VPRRFFEVFRYEHEKMVPAIVQQKNTEYFYHRIMGFSKSPDQWINSATWLSLYYTPVHIRTVLYILYVPSNSPTIK
jgi:hypothetical protein